MKLDRLRTIKTELNLKISLNKFYSIFIENVGNIKK